MLHETSSHLAILETRETLFFSRPDPAGPLCQWIEVVLGNDTGGPLAARAVIAAGGEEAHTSLSLLPGEHPYRCYAPTLWPRWEAAPQAPLTVQAGDHVARSTCAVGSHRPWTVYLLSDTCVDYTWAYEDLARYKADAAAVIRAEMAACRETAAARWEDQNRYSLLHTGELEFFMEHASAAEAEEWAQWCRSGHFSLSPYRNMAMTTAQTLEEGIRQFYLARDLAQRWGIPICYANHQETPTIVWSQATVLAESGIPYLVKSILPYECPWTPQLTEPPLYYWEGPDGSRVLVRLHKTDYVEGRFVREGVEAIEKALHQRLLPQYEALGATYPLDALALVGFYGDLAPKTPEYAALKTRHVAAYNARGWEYPKLVNASHELFWRAVEEQQRTRQVTLPVYRGDYGTAWDAWPVALARSYAQWRRAQERSYAADALVALAASLRPAWFDAQREALEKAWEALLRLSDHAWNGSSDGSRALNAALRESWHGEANAGFDALIGDSLQVLGKEVSTPAERSVSVFNTLGWARAGVVTLPNAAEGASGTARRTASVLARRVVDQVSGDVMPCQEGHDEEGQPVLRFLARDVPAFGYRTYTLESAPVDATPGVVVSEDGLENAFYRLRVSASTGGIVSLYDKVRACELVDGASPYHLGQLLHLADDEDLSLTAVRVRPGECGALQGQLCIEGVTRRTTVRVTITLYSDLEGVFLAYQLHKEGWAEREQINVAFPFQVPGRRYRVEKPGVIVAPGDSAHGGEQRPGAGQAVHMARHVVEVYNDAVGVTLVLRDGGVVQFGHRTQGESPQQPDPSNSTVLALALSNLLDAREILHDQHGDQDFRFRYVLFPHQGGLDAAEAVRRGMDSTQELWGVALSSAQRGSLPAGQHSWLNVQPPQVIPTALKVAHEGLEGGMILRLWAPGALAGTHEAEVTVQGWGTLREAQVTDLLERDRQPLSAEEGLVRVPIKPRGLATVRLRPA